MPESGLQPETGETDAAVIFWRLHITLRRMAQVCCRQDIRGRICLTGARSWVMAHQGSYHRPAAPKGRADWPQPSEAQVRGTYQTIQGNRQENRRG
ncbi:MAG: hypothetical protein BJ554DRAFT_1669 [Olpidium bornovanus]|uniref:Uncharacterized protein n=1 Tax=Olpidium bornovanus TaxID=278681 RepID=A0A8H8A166_9FUNG|nr:MAG: hypothetical protein BJ554DRAFT_1669 [Olpidium bornovanus]